MADKIKISWDDLKSDKVDQKVKQQEMFERVRIHQEEVMRNAPPLPGGMPPPLPGTMPMGATAVAGGSILMKSVVYLALFGLLGGLFAWGASELTWLIGEKEQKEAMEWQLFVTARQSGEISQYRAAEIVEERADKNPYFYAAMQARDFEDFTSRTAPLRDKAKSLSAIQQACWLGFAALFIATFLGMAEPIVSKNWNRAITNALIAGVVGGLGGSALSFVLNHIYTVLGGGGNSSLAIQIFARAVGWGLAGCFLAIAPGILMRSGRKLLTGVLGGLIGGLLGGLLFDPVAMATNSGGLSRFVGIVGIGVLSGVGIGILENALKSGWLKVLVGPIKGKQFILYRNPTRIGSSPQSEIYLFKDPTISPAHAAISMSGGGFTIENIGSGSTYVNGTPVTKKKLASGDEIAIGNTRLLFEGKA